MCSIYFVWMNIFIFHSIQWSNFNRLVDECESINFVRTPICFSLQSIIVNSTREWEKDKWYQSNYNVWLSQFSIFYLLFCIEFHRNVTIKIDQLLFHWNMKSMKTHFLRCRERTSWLFQIWSMDWPWAKKRLEKHVVRAMSVTNQFKLWKKGGSF